MKKATLLTLVFIFALSGISMAKDAGFGMGGLAHGKGKVGMFGGKWWKMSKVSDKLALTFEEKEKLDNISQNKYILIQLQIHTPIYQLMSEIKRLISQGVD